MTIWVLRVAELESNSAALNPYQLDFNESALSSLSDGVTTLNLQFDYFNSSSSKCLLDTIRSVSRMQTSENSVVVNWHYQVEDVDMKETGEDLESLARVNFNLIDVKE